MNTAFLKAAREFIVYDLEYTAWEGSWERGWSEPWELREIVEIGALRMLREAHGLRPVSEFTVFVKPARNPVLSRYFTNLTGIDQGMLDTSGVGFADAMRKFAKFADGSMPLFSYGQDDEILLENCRLAQVACPIERHRLINYRAWLRGELGIAPHENVSSCDLPARIGLKTDLRRKHRAVDDAEAQVLTLASILGMSYTMNFPGRPRLTAP